MGTIDFDLVTLTLEFDFKKKIDIGLFFLIISIRVSYCTGAFLVMRFSYWYQDI